MSAKGGLPMFRSMRRSRQQLENDETIKILRSGTTGVLGLTGDDGYPYMGKFIFMVQGRATNTIP